MAKEDVMAEISKGIAEHDIVIGTNEVKKNLKLSRLAKVYFAKNCDAFAKSDIIHYACLAGTEVINLPYPNDELGILCKKQFSISVIGLMKKK